MKFIIEESGEVLTAHAGLAAVGSLLQKTHLRARLNATRLNDRPASEISHGDLVTSHIGLLCLGKNDFDHTEAHRQEVFFHAAVGVRAVPSSPTLRQRLDMAAGLRSLHGEGFPPPMTNAVAAW